MSKGKRIGYVRVSSVDQNTERQLDGIELDRTFTDKASGKSADRPQLAAALSYLREGDTLVIHSMDRLARNTEDLLRIVRELREAGVAVEFIKDNMSFTASSANPQAELMMTMLGAFAQFERALIGERQREGIAIAKAAGVYRGRKAALDSSQAQQLRERVASGEAKAAVARDFGISRETLYQYLKQSSTSA